MDSRHPRFTAGACMLTALFVGGTAGVVGSAPIMIESFETYMDTDHLRMFWTVQDRLPPTTIDLETSEGIKGPPQHGEKYMRVNYLITPTVIATDLGGADWTDYDVLRLWYRGLSAIYNDVIAMQVELTSSSSSYFGPVEPNISVCVPEGAHCVWTEHVFDFSEWPDRGDVQSVRVQVITEAGNAEFYLDAIQIDTGMVSSETDTWGAIKTLYR